MTVLFFDHISVKINFFWVRTSSSPFFYQVSWSPKVCCIFIKNRQGYKWKLFFADFEMFAIVSDIVEHVLITLFVSKKILAYIKIQYI